VDGFLGEEVECAEGGGRWVISLKEAGSVEKDISFVSFQSDVHIQFT
jgi:hypothetical protein